MTPTLGLRHAVLWVRDPHASARFYEAALGLVVKQTLDGAVFMTSPASATDHDLALFQARDPQPPQPGRIGLYHLAWEVGTLDELRDAAERLADLGAVVGSADHGVSRSIYARDPDGIEFEVMWEVPTELLDDQTAGLEPLDLAADLDRFGGQRPGRGVADPTD